MRDGEIIREQQANMKRNGLMLAQFEFLKTRQEAFEIALKGSTLWRRVWWALSPVAFMDAVDRVQVVLLEQSKRQLDEAAMKVKIERVPAGVLPG